MDVEIQATLETRTSKKGKDYEVIVIKLSDNAEHLVFLNSAELELLKLYNGIQVKAFYVLIKKEQKGGI